MSGLFKKPKREHVPLHEVGNIVRLTPEELTFLNNLARRIGDFCYASYSRHLSYDDMDRLREITRRANPVKTE